MRPLEGTASSFNIYYIYKL
uniref:Uncharacterized protein n=1 Tax=Lepeophtheirus salmonis TaxID=72036 RepID=A0A0K2V6W2_LEPSM